MKNYRFEDLNLKAPFLKALNEEGYTSPTPIQKETIPLVLQGQDLMGMAQTGTGKLLPSPYQFYKNLMLINQQKKQEIQEH